jgi:hypothetical protein
MRKKTCTTLIVMKNNVPSNRTETSCAFAFSCVAASSHSTRKRAQSLPRARISSGAPFGPATPMAKVSTHFLLLVHVLYMYPVSFVLVARKQ